MDWAVVAQVLAVAISAFIAITGYRRGTKADATVAHSGMATETRAGVEQIINGLNDLAGRLQEDNQSFRDTQTRLIERINDLERDNRACFDKAQILAQQLDKIEAKRDATQRELDRMIAKYET